MLACGKIYDMQMRLQDRKGHKASNNSGSKENLSAWLERCPWAPASWASA